MVLRTVSRKERWGFLYSYLSSGIDGGCSICRRIHGRDDHDEEGGNSQRVEDWKESLNVAILFVLNAVSFSVGTGVLVILVVVNKPFGN